jgi:lysophospholipase L1-like esterase
MRRSLLVTSLATLVLLEVVLQIGALVVWHTRRDAPEAPPREGERVVLCIGDSFTYGIGSTRSALAYPAQLQHILRRAGHGDLRVVSCAWPGRHSREALELVDGQLAEFKPELVYVLVGLNDQWAKPELLTLPELGEESRADGREASFTLEWRTGRFIVWAFGRLTAPAAVGSAPPVEPTRAAAAVDEGDSERREEAAVTQGEPEITDGWQAVKLREPDLAERIWEQDLQENPEGAHHSRAGLVYVYAAKGEAKKVHEQLSWLRRTHAEKPSADVAAALVDALTNAGDRDESFELAKRLVAEYPEHAKFWETLGWQSYQRRQLGVAASAIERAVALVPDDQITWKATLLRRQSKILQKLDPHRALVSSVRSYLLERVTPHNGWGVLACSPAQLEEVLDELAVAPQMREPIEKQFARTLGWGTSDVERVYDAHLHQIARRCSRAGAEPVFVSYPTPIALESVLERLAGQLQHRRRCASAPARSLGSAVGGTGVRIGSPRRSCRSASRPACVEAPNPARRTRTARRSRARSGASRRSRPCPRTPPDSPP